MPVFNTPPVLPFEVVGVRLNRFDAIDPFTYILNKVYCRVCHMYQPTNRYDYTFGKCFDCLNEREKEYLRAQGRLKVPQKREMEV
jgi:hypothetical protein